MLDAARYYFCLPSIFVNEKDHVAFIFFFCESAVILSFCREFKYKSTMEIFANASLQMLTYLGYVIFYMLLI